LRPNMAIRFRLSNATSNVWKPRIAMWTRIADTAGVESSVNVP
jgi:hypothetical protein